MFSWGGRCDNSFWAWPATVGVKRKERNKQQQYSSTHFVFLQYNSKSYRKLLQWELVMFNASSVSFHRNVANYPKLLFNFILFKANEHMTRSKSIIKVFFFFWGLQQSLWKLKCISQPAQSENSFPLFENQAVPV